MDLWTEKYRPATLDDYVWRDPDQRTQVESWITAGALPHLLLSGVQGSGKTSLALMAFKLLGVQSGDILHINASRERNPDVIADKILGFCTTWGLGGMKYILLDEADSMTPLAQRILRGEMENYHASVRFILTCNYPGKIIPALHSRCQGFHFQALDKDEILMRVLKMLMTEGVSIETEEDIANVQAYVDADAPDLRKIINVLQQNVDGTKLTPIKKVDAAGPAWYMDMTGLFSMGRVREARQLAVANLTNADEWEALFRFMYDNLEAFGFNEEQQDEAILRIAQAYNNHLVVGDPEINFAALMVQLFRVTKG